MKDINYFLDRASISTQGEFELDFADVIEIFDARSTTLTTEEGRTLVINWREDESFKSFYVIYETAQMEQHAAKVNQVINILRDIDVDGETLQYILEKVGMEDQMLKQLICTADDYQINYYNSLRNMLKKSLK
jgi:hypothetical protein